MIRMPRRRDGSRVTRTNKSAKAGALLFLRELPCRPPARAPKGHTCPLLSLIRSECQTENERKAPDGFVPRAASTSTTVLKLQCAFLPTVKTYMSQKVSG